MIRRHFFIFLFFKSNFKKRYGSIQLIIDTSFCLFFVCLFLIQIYILCLINPFLCWITVQFIHDSSLSCSGLKSSNQYFMLFLTTLQHIDYPASLDSRHVLMLPTGSEIVIIKFPLRYRKIMLHPVFCFF